jgi:hypothetical protein
MMRGKSLIGLKILRDHEECAVPVTLLPCPRARTGPLTRRRRRRWPRRAGEGACRCDERLEFGAGEELPELSGRLPLAAGRLNTVGPGRRLAVLPVGDHHELGADLAFRIVQANPPALVSSGACPAARYHGCDGGQPARSSSVAGVIVVWCIVPRVHCAPAAALRHRQGGRAAVRPRRCRPVRADQHHDPRRRQHAVGARLQGGHLRPRLAAAHERARRAGAARRPPVRTLAGRLSGRSPAPSRTHGAAIVRCPMRAQRFLTPYRMVIPLGSAACSATPVR